MKDAERTQVVIDETTIYEIDLDCYECEDGACGKTDAKKNDNKQK